MPTFDFACSDCKELFEFNRSFSSNEHPACPSCKSTNTSKQMHTPNIVFKGSGFYKTDSSKIESKATTKDSPAKVAEKTAVPEKAEKKPTND